MKNLFKVAVVLALSIISISCEKEMEFETQLEPIETVGVKLAYGKTQEAAIKMYENKVSALFMPSNSEFETSDLLCKVYDGTEYAEANYYYNGRIVRLWNGQTFIY
ncbi:hypothetical protein [Costertonia aggregata]|uniref:Uncharacterized protein n=1 Tax=Costertonia aggregata TaxID=343403 RepID=A0A7H9ARM0_9FLAO|nr:hypothetical protein [Costertonia aggregata]QLG46066.1 hypothetical protein HYG79_12155 [Costertonia aggregata]